METVDYHEQPSSAEPVHGPVAFEGAAAAAALARQPVIEAARPVGAHARENFMVAIALAVSEASTRERVHKLLLESESVIKSKAAAGMTQPFELPTDQAKVLEWLQGYFVEGSPTPLILISDLLKPPSETIDGFLTRECQARFAKHALGTVAILQSSGRVMDIDRTIRSDVGRDELTRVMVLLIGRLEYLTAPKCGRQVDPDDIVIRQLRSDNETQFREYFKLRHRVYSRMGYLDAAVENSPSGLEMTEVDVRSIHFGAFYHEALIGSARVVTNDNADDTLIDLFESIASQDPVARQHLRKAYQFVLPIFESHRGMTGPMIEIIEAGQKCGELSRVIVDRAYRGKGISGQLIEVAKERAVRRGLQRVFLECLKVHEPLYQKHGFKCIDGIEGKVIDVERTMIAMELQSDEIEKVKARLE